MNWLLVLGIKDQNMKCLQMLLNSLKGKKNKEISSEIIQPKKMIFNNSLFTDQSLKEFAIF